MADVRPFRGIRYNPKQHADMTPLMSPPYDVIDAKLQQALYDRSSYGIVRIDFGMTRPEDGETDNQYTRAAEQFCTWLTDGVMIREEAPALYYVEEDYTGEFGVPRTRSGFLASVRVETAESGLYRPHEKTMSGPKADRLNLTRACRANLSPIFSLFDDPEQKIDDAFAAWRTGAGVPDMEVESLDGVKVRMWKVDDAAVCATVRDVMAPKSFFIADGHHRYETALNYRNEMARANPNATGEEPWNFVLMYLVNLWSPGLTVLPTHRAIHSIANFVADRFLEKLGRWFTLKPVDGGVEALLGLLEESRGDGQAFGLAVHGVGTHYLITPKAEVDFDALLASRAEVLRPLDVTVLHGLIIEQLLGVDEKAQEEQRNIRFVKDAHELDRLVRDGEMQLGVFMNPTHVAQVKTAAEAGERMPQKSTYFYPKILTGLLVHPLWEED